MTFTFQQLLADGHMGLSAAQVHLTDGSKALYADSADDAVPEEVLASYDLSWGGSWFEAAQELQLPLYSVRALLELPAAYSAESMEGALWQEDGSITYFSMPLLASVPSQSEIPATLYMQVTQYDPFSQSVLATWQAQEDISLPMTPMLAEKTYLPTQETYFAGLKLENVPGHLVCHRHLFHSAVHSAGAHDGYGRAGGSESYQHTGRSRLSLTPGHESLRMHQHSSAA